MNHASAFEDHASAFKAYDSIILSVKPGSLRLEYFDLDSCEYSVYRKISHFPGPEGNTKKWYMSVKDNFMEILHCIPSHCNDPQVRRIKESLTKDPEDFAGYKFVSNFISDLLDWIDKHNGHFEVQTYKGRNCYEAHYCRSSHFKNGEPPFFEKVVKRPTLVNELSDYNKFSTARFLYATLRNRTE